MQPAIPLEFLQVGEQGRIVDLDGRSDVVCRLEEMGFQRGAVVRMVQPGSPCIVALGHHRVSFRGDEAANLIVELVDV